MRSSRPAVAEGTAQPVLSLNCPVWLTPHIVLPSILEPNAVSRDRSDPASASGGNARGTLEEQACDSYAGCPEEDVGERRPTGTGDLWKAALRVATLPEGTSRGEGRTYSIPGGRSAPSDRESRTPMGRPGMRTICVLLIAACVPIWQGIGNMGRAHSTGIR